MDPFMLLSRSCDTVTNRVASHGTIPMPAASCDVRADVSAIT